MSTISSILSAAAQAMQAHQQGMSVTSHNITNAETEGYTRQRARLGAATPLITPQGVIGRGVGLEDVERTRDALLDGSFRRESALAGAHAERVAHLGRIEEVLGEPSETGLLAAMDAFWNAWSDLASDPGSTTARAVVRERGQQLADRFGQIAGGLGDAFATASAALDGMVDRANGLIASVADVNGRIVASEAGGHPANDLRDERDRLLDELGGLVEIQVIDRGNGAVGVHMAGSYVVDGTTSRGLARTTDGAGNEAVRIVNGPTVSSPGGRVAGVLGTLNNEIGQAQADLDGIARDLVNEVNRLLENAVDPRGIRGGDFFAAAGTTAATVALSADVLATTDAIGAGPGGAYDPVTDRHEYRPGTNDVALQIQALRDVAVGGGVLAERFTELVSGNAGRLNAARSSADVHQALADQTDLQRARTHGVSIDEELAMIVRQQAAFAAAAKVVARADEMLQSVLGMV